MPDVHSLAQRWLRARPISSQLPVAVGGRVLKAMLCECPRCQRPVRDEDLRGVVEPLTEAMVLLDAFGYCPDCSVIAHFVYRARDGGSALALESLVQDEGGAPQWKEELPDAWSALHSRLLQPGSGVESRTSA